MQSVSGAITLGQSGPGIDGNKRVLCIPQSSSITRASLLDCLVSYPEHSLRESYLSADMQSVYSTVPADWPKGSGKEQAKTLWIIKKQKWGSFLKVII